MLSIPILYGAQLCTGHCTEPTPKTGNKYSQKRNCVARFMCLWAIYTFPQSICLLCCRKYVDRSWEYINSSQTHECGNWDWGRAIPRKGIHKWNFRCSVGLIFCLLYVCLWVNNIGSKTIFSYFVGPVGPGNGESGLLSKDHFQEGQGQDSCYYHKKVKF